MALQGERGMEEWRGREGIYKHILFSLIRRLAPVFTVERWPQIDGAKGGEPLRGMHADNEAAPVVTAAGMRNKTPPSTRPEVFFDGAASSENKSYSL